MHTRIDQNHTPTMFTVHKALDIVNSLNTEEDDWTYKTRSAGIGMGCYVDVYDESGEFVESF